MSKEITNKEIMTHLFAIELILRERFNISEKHMNNIIYCSREYLKDIIGEEK